MQRREKAGRRQSTRGEKHKVLEKSQVKLSGGRLWVGGSAEGTERSDNGVDQRQASPVIISSEWFSPAPALLIHAETDASLHRPEYEHWGPIGAGFPRIATPKMPDVLGENYLCMTEMSTCRLVWSLVSNPPLLPHQKRSGKPYRTSFARCLDSEILSKYYLDPTSL